jgi:hypothetical protein
MRWKYCSSTLDNLVTLNSAITGVWLSTDDVFHRDWMQKILYFQLDLNTLVQGNGYKFHEYLCFNGLFSLLMHIITSVPCQNYVSAEYAAMCVAVDNISL